MRPVRSSWSLTPLVVGSLLVATGIATDAATAARGRGRSSDSTEEVARRVVVMGTSLSMRVRAADRATALAASEAGLRAIEAVEHRLSTWSDTSELARLNASPLDAPFVLSESLAADLAVARRWWRATRGAFDPGVGALVSAFALREGGRLPGETVRANAHRASGMDGLELRGRTARRRRAGLAIEEGAFGKGRGLDAALAALREAGATGAVLDLGGQVLAWGDACPVVLAVAHPDRRDEPVATIRLREGSVATTGNSERGFTIDGHRFAHVLDPRRGRLCPDFGSVTVRTADATSADCLSTALYVMGPDAAIAWAEERPGVEVLVLERPGEKTRRSATGPRDEGNPRSAPRLRARASSGLVGHVSVLVGGDDPAFPTTLETPQESVPPVHDIVPRNGPCDATGGIGETENGEDDR